VKQIYLASSINNTAKSIAEKIGSAKNKKLVFITTASEVEEGDKQWLENDRQYVEVKDGMYNIVEVEH
jgi:uncharacterized FlgJ-related protein